MATYAELIAASGNSDLINKVRVACIVAANNIRLNGTATAAQKTWAKAVFANPESAQVAMMWCLLAQNKDAALSAIQSVTDAQVQTAVDASVALFSE